MGVVHFPTLGCTRDSGGMLVVGSADMAHHFNVNQLWVSAPPPPTMIA